MIFEPEEVKSSKNRFCFFRFLSCCSLFLLCLLVWLWLLLVPFICWIFLSICNSASSSIYLCLVRNIIMCPCDTLKREFRSHLVYHLPEHSLYITCKLILKVLIAKLIYVVWACSLLTLFLWLSFPNSQSDLFCYSTPLQTSIPFSFFSHSHTFTVCIHILHSVDESSMFYTNLKPTQKYHPDIKCQMKTIKQMKTTFPFRNRDVYKYGDDNDKVMRLMNTQIIIVCIDTTSRQRYNV